MRARERVRAGRFVGGGCDDASAAAEGGIEHAAGSTKKRWRLYDAHGMPDMPASGSCTIDAGRAEGSSIGSAGAADGTNNGEVTAVRSASNAMCCCSARSALVASVVKSVRYADALTASCESSTRRTSAIDVRLLRRSATPSGVFSVVEREDTLRRPRKQKPLNIASSSLCAGTSATTRSTASGYSAGVAHCSMGCSTAQCSVINASSAAYSGCVAHVAPASSKYAPHASVCAAVGSRTYGKIDNPRRPTTGLHDGAQSTTAALRGNVMGSMSVPPSSIVSGRVLHRAGYKYAVAAAAPGAGAGRTRPKHGIAHGAVRATRVCTIGVPTGATPCGCAAGITSSSSK